MHADVNQDHLYPEFDDRRHQVAMMMQDYCKLHLPGYTFVMVEGYRNAEYQAWLYAKGRTRWPGPSVTNADGVHHLSKHQSSMAADHAFKHNETGALEFFTAGSSHWEYYGHCCRSVGLEWGGDWKSFKDCPHCQWSAHDLVEYRKAQAWQHVKGLR